MTGIYKNNSFILTKTGWKNLEDFLSGEIPIGSEIFSFNIKENKEEWTPILGINVTNNSKLYKINFNKSKEILVSPDCLWIVDVNYSKLDEYLKGNLPDSETRLLKTEDVIPYFSNRSKHGSSMFLHKFKVRLNAINFSIGMRFNSEDPYLDTSDIRFDKINKVYDTWSPITLNSTFICKYNNQIFILGCYPDSTIKSNGITTQPLFLINYNIEEPITIPPIKAYSSEGSIEKLIILERPPNFVQLKNDGQIINNYPTEINFNHNLELMFLENFEGRIVIPYNVKDIRNNYSIFPSTITILTQNASFNTTPENNINFNLLNELYQSINKKNIPDGYVGLNSLGKINADFIDINSLYWNSISTQSINSLFFSLFNSISDENRNLLNEIVDNKLSWNNIIDKPNEFYPSNHYHNWNNIENKPEDLIFINDNISLLNNDIGYITEREFYTSKNIFYLEGSISNTESYLNISSNNNQNPTLDYLIENNTVLKIINNDNYFIDINLQLPIINLDYTYLTKYKINIKINSSDNIFFCSSINSNSSNLFEFYRNINFNIPSNSLISVIISLIEEENNNFQFILNNSSFNLLKIYK